MVDLDKAAEEKAMDAEDAEDADTEGEESCQIDASNTEELRKGLSKRKRIHQWSVHRLLQGFIRTGL